MGFIGREGLLKKDELRIEKVELGDGDFTYVREMTAREKDRLEQSMMKEVKDSAGKVEIKRNMEDFRAKLAVNTLCDENGFNIMNLDDVETLSQNKSATTMEKIISKAQELNKISEEDKERMVKNSEGGKTADSPSD